MTNNPKVSVVVPSLNSIKYIHECIDSILNQTLKDIEIICVDAGSTDGTLEVLREYEKNDERLKVIVSDKKSYGYQINLGIKEAKGEYLGIVESDDCI
ncbi:glycosyltransferase family 2 protein, partial [Campylobacter coli]|nr:glycosyltransferase family 2 protein [Campylobacter coli]